MIRCVLQRAARHAAHAVARGAQARSVSTRSAAKAIAQARGGHRHVARQVKPAAYESAAMAARRSQVASAAACQRGLPTICGPCAVRGVLAEARSFMDANVFWKNYAAFLFGCYASAKIMTRIHTGQF